MHRLTFAAAVTAALLTADLHADEIEPAADVQEATGWKKVAVAEGLVNPWGLAFLPDGSYLVTERPGNLRRISADGEVGGPIKGLPDIYAVNQGGLLDVVLHPDFEDNNTIYFTYSAGEEESNRVELAKGRLDGDTLTDVEAIFYATPDKEGGQHFGSRVVFLEDGTLLMSIGDGGNPPTRIDGTLAREHGQRLDSTLASIVRLNDDGSVPDDNPFIGEEGAKPELFSIGHRNVQGIAIDPDSGRIWVNEHGALGGDELNLVEKGENYGWPEQTYSLDYRTGRRFAPKVVDGFRNPKAVWTPAQAPSGLLFYTGDKFPDWRGSLFSGGLLTQEIRRIKLDGENVTGEESLPINERVRHVAQGPDGFIYVLTDEADGTLFRIEPE